MMQIALVLFLILLLAFWAWMFSDMAKNGRLTLTFYRFKQRDRCGLAVFIFTRLIYYAIQTVGAASTARTTASATESLDISAIGQADCPRPGMCSDRRTDRR